MSTKATSPKLVELDLDGSIWGRFYTVHPLVLIGTREQDGGTDLAPKHLAMPMSWRNHFGFVCTPAHRTYQNILRSGQFSVTFLRPSQTVFASLSATPRCEEGDKPIINALPTFPASKIDCDFLQDGYLFLQCELRQTVDDLGENSLVIGNIIAADIAPDALRSSDRDDQDLVHESPLLAYLYPDRFAEIKATNKLPFPSGFKR